jgi:DNA-binding PadR family transcriptional regulator
MKLKQTAHVILGILAIHDDQSGYEIRKTIQQSVGFFWGESYGQIYPTLKRLAAGGLIVPSKSTSQTRPKRQEYCITGAGRSALQEWLAVPYRDNPPRDEFLLKLFFGVEAFPSLTSANSRRKTATCWRLCCNWNLWAGRVVRTFRGFPSGSSPSTSA